MAQVLIKHVLKIIDRAHSLFITIVRNIFTRLENKRGYQFLTGIPIWLFFMAMDEIKRHALIKNITFLPLISLLLLFYTGSGLGYCRVSLFLI
ncbi:hypothetical protein [Mixta hanseatica]|uniref:Uncharacterized protein n=1 Tax=Mixta hanseatica TaxID=2872648 RepID=A0ABY4R8M1_9GAMM|nr:hypothetical protein [Mixta hanseatica]UQY43171.1 hypothetical protein K6958_14905 [Mixta hanseatica]